MKKLLLTILLLCLFFALAGSTQAVTTIVEDYPELPGAIRPGEAAPGEALPQLIKYIFIFSLSIVGVIGLAAIIIGAFGYLTAVGNPQKAADAKDKIFSALLGIILLLGSFLLLRTINPDLLKLGVEAPAVIVDNPSNGNGTMGCRLSQASWDKGTINAGQSASVIFTLSNECKDIAVDINVKETLLKQERPGIAWNPLCRKIYCVDSSQMNRHGLELKWLCMFDGECRDKLGITECSEQKDNLICNFIDGALEIFYLEGEIKINDVKQYIPKLYIQVKDLLDDGTCCK